MNFNIVSLNAKVTELESLINTHLATIAERDNSIGDLQRTIEGFPNVTEIHAAEISALKESHDKTVAELKATHETAIKDLQDQLKATQESANKVAHKIVAGLGIPEAEVKVPTEDTNTKTPEQLSAEFHSMPHGVERTAFWNKNKEAILSTFRKK